MLLARQQPDNEIVTGNSRKHDKILSLQFT
jgi:hypothetical protein